LATSGDFLLATTGDFFMAMDSWGCIRIRVVRQGEMP